MSLLDPWPKAAVACPTCGYELPVSIARIDAEGLPWCTHDHGTITYDANPYPTWTRMVRVGRESDVPSTRTRACASSIDGEEMEVVRRGLSVEINAWDREDDEMLWTVALDSYNAKRLAFLLDAEAGRA